MSQSKKFALIEQRGSISGDSEAQRPDFGGENEEEEKKDHPQLLIPRSTVETTDEKMEQLIDNGYHQDNDSKEEIANGNSQLSNTIDILTKIQQQRMKLKLKRSASKDAWLSMETTLEDVDVKKQSFTIEGWMTLFWKDDSKATKRKLDTILNYTDIQGRIQKLQNDHVQRYQAMLDNKKNPDKVKKKMKSAGYMADHYVIEDNVIILQQQNTSTSPSGDKDDDEIPEFERKDKKDDGFNGSDDNDDDNNGNGGGGRRGKRFFESIRQYGRRKDIFLKFSKHGIQKLKVLGYRFPFYWSSSNRQFQMFRNEIDYQTIGENGIELEYNYEHKVFKLHIHFRATLYECFENNYNDFPFEWQFLNCQLLLNIFEYSFKAKVPNFVKEAFMSFEYWYGSTFLWKHAILARKRDNIDEWKLLSPWMDLRDDEHRWNDYRHEFHFSLIKLRVIRNPNYYLSYIIAPLFLMVSCAFAVFFIDPDEGRLSYIVTLLLTVAAFQISVSTDLPYESQFTLIDKYFMLAYYILASLVLESGIAQHMDPYEYLDYMSASICGIVWISYSVKYLEKWMEFERNDKCTKFWTSACFCCPKRIKCLCGYKHYMDLPYLRWPRRYENWLEMDRRESSQWDRLQVIRNKSRKAEVVYGTEGDIMIRGIIDGEVKQQYYEKGKDEKTGKVVLWRINEYDDGKGKKEKSKTIVMYFDTILGESTKDCRRGTWLSRKHEFVWLYKKYDEPVELDLIVGDDDDDDDDEDNDDNDEDNGDGDSDGDGL